MSCWSWTAVPSRWHFPHRNGTFCGRTGDFGSFTLTTSCPVWHVQQRGAVASPFFTAFPWRLSAYIVTMSPWQASQVGAASFSS